MTDINRVVIASGVVFCIFFMTKIGTSVSNVDGVQTVKYIILLRNLLSCLLTSMLVTAKHEKTTTNKQNKNKTKPRNIS